MNTDLNYHPSLAVFVAAAGSKGDPVVPGLSPEDAARLVPYKVFLGRILREHDEETFRLCCDRILAQVKSGNNVAGQAVLESIMRERGLSSFSRPGSVLFGQH